jgi:hypothetical protein
MPPYLLSAHSYVCIADDYAVFLDLKHDKYTALEPADTRTLPSLIRGWPCTEKPTAAEWKAPTQSSAEIVQMLLDEGLVTDNEATGKAATPIALKPAPSSISAVTGHFPRVGFADFFNFVTAWLITTAMLRLLPLRLSVARVRRRKERNHSTAEQFDVQTAHRLMMAYFILRPNFFSNADACLRDSLTFVEFLSRYGLYPTWIFGVKMNPFAAHAWVQDGCMVLNDHTPHVNRFIPIMAI